MGVHLSDHLLAAPGRLHLPPARPAQPQHPQAVALQDRQGEGKGRKKQGQGRTPQPAPRTALAAGGRAKAQQSGSEKEGERTEVFFTPRVRAGQEEESESMHGKVCRDAAPQHMHMCLAPAALGASYFSESQKRHLENSRNRLAGARRITDYARRNADRRARDRQKTRRGPASKAGAVRTSAASDAGPHDAADGSGAPTARTSERSHHALTGYRARNPWRISWTLHAVTTAV